MDLALSSRIQLPAMGQVKVEQLELKHVLMEQFKEEKLRFESTWAMKCQR